MYCKPTSLLSLSIRYGSLLRIIILKNIVTYPKEGTTPIRNWTPIFSGSTFTIFWFLFSFGIYAEFEINVMYQFSC
jgi:hypothetical protein